MTPDNEHTLYQITHDIRPFHVALQCLSCTLTWHHAKMRGFPIMGGCWNPHMQNNSRAHLGVHCWSHLQLCNHTHHPMYRAQTRHHIHTRHRQLHQAGPPPDPPTQLHQDPTTAQSPDPPVPNPEITTPEQTRDWHALIAWQFLLQKWVRCWTEKSTGWGMTWSSTSTPCLTGGLICIKTLHHNILSFTTESSLWFWTNLLGVQIWAMTLVLHHEAMKNHSYHVYTVYSSLTLFVIYVEHLWLRLWDYTVIKMIELHNDITELNMV